MIPAIVVGFSLFQFLLVRLNLSVNMSLFIGHTLVIIPYIIRVIGSSLEVFDYSIEEAAMSLGCKKSQTFFKVVLPNITSGVMAAFMLAFINSFNNVPVSMFLTGPGVSTLPITMMNYVEYNYDPTVSALSVILMILTIGIMYILAILHDKIIYTDLEDNKMDLIKLQNINVSYDKKNNILENLNLNIKKGELVSLLGPSGCGKTTTLRVVAGFIEPTAGNFYLGDEDYTKIPVHNRNFGLVFQSYALFPHLTVEENVAFGLKMKKAPKDEINKKVADILETVDMSHLAKRYPKELSGGQRQRVAIARALVIEPSLLLLDEPLSNLDAKLRLKMRVEIRKLQQKLGITTLFVTHDQEECFSISDKVAVLNKGVIEQFDTPENIYSNPATEFVARFVGFENFIDLKKTSENIYSSENNIGFKVDRVKDKKEVKATIRPDDIKIVDEETENTIEGVIEIRTFLGKAYQYDVKTSIGNLIVNSENSVVYEKGNKIKLQLPSNKIVIL